MYVYIRVISIKVKLSSMRLEIDLTFKHLSRIFYCHIVNYCVSYCNNHNTLYHNKRSKMIILKVNHSQMVPNSNSNDIEIDNERG